MTKQDIINQVSNRADLSRSKAEEAVETVIDLIKDALGQGEAVILRRFGTFQVRSKSKRMGRNPKTGEEAEISARKVVRFKSGKHFKQAVNDEDME
ncbi:MAG: integration host factor subunit alpha [Nitrospinaceae bacterium]|jgi:integration host factor alpha subunit|nr:integration host factor subunit alpha [Nitrospinaceae bacterium]MDP7058197.1 integration host factor subunit alpha [Nitrospinaceae bacterium]